MPPCPWANTAGTFDTAVFAPCCVTSQSGPTFSVMSMRPSGRNAMRHGKLNVVTWLTVNGRLDSGVFSPALTWACTATDTKGSKSVARTNTFIGFPPRVFSAMINEGYTVSDARRQRRKARAYRDGKAVNVK